MGALGWSAEACDFGVVLQGEERTGLGDRRDERGVALGRSVQLDVVAGAPVVLDVQGDTLVEASHLAAARDGAVVADDDVDLVVLGQVDHRELLFVTAAGVTDAGIAGELHTVGAEVTEVLVVDHVMGAVGTDADGTEIEVGAGVPLHGGDEAVEAGGDGGA